MGTCLPVYAIITCTWEHTHMLACMHTHTHTHTRMHTRTHTHTHTHTHTDEAEPSTHSTTSNISRTPLTSQLSEEFNLTFREDSLGSDTVWTEDTGPPVSSGEQGGEVVREKDTEPSTLVTSEATVTIS